MPTPDDFEVTQFQTAVFTPDIQFQNRKILAHLLTRWGDVLDGVPFSLPVTEHAPGGLPPIILESESGQYRIQVSPARMDIFWKFIPGEPDLDPAAFINWASQVLAGYVGETSARIGRLACVVTKAALVVDPGPVLASHFCQERWTAGPMAHLRAFELHTHTRELIGQRFEVNAWTRCKTGTKEFKIEAAEADAETVTTVPVVIVEQDFNTPGEETATRQFSPDEAHQFFILTTQAMNEVLRAYFPG